MISEEIENRIILLFKIEKWPQSTIARELGVHRGVVRRVLRTHPETKEHFPRSRLIDPYVIFIKEKLTEYPNLRASRLFQMVVERGYQGKSDHFRAMLRKIRPEKKYEAFTRLSVLEGEQAQVDWASFGKIKIGKHERNLSAFVMVLSWSRQIFLKYYLSMETGIFLQAHVEAFEFFSGVPREILHDNLKSAVIERYDNLVKFNERYLRFASHYCFLPKACNIRRGNEKGRVERSIRFIRENFFAGREFRDLEDLNRQAYDWCIGISGERKCRSDNMFTVAQAFKREQNKLQRLPNDAYPARTIDFVKVGKTHYARFDRNDYSVPGDYVRKQLSVQANHNQVEFFYNEKSVATHARCWGKGECILNPKHANDITEQKSRTIYSRTLENLFVLLPSAKQFLEKIAEQGGSLGNSVQSLHVCLGDYGIELMTEGVAIAIQKPKTSIVDLRIIVEKLQAQKGKKNPLALSTASEEKARELTIIKPDLSKYDRLGE